MFDLAARRLETQMNRDIFQAAPELTLIIGAFRYSCKTDMGRETWPCGVPAIVKKWLLRAKTSHQGEATRREATFMAIHLSVRSPSAYTRRTTLRNTREWPMPRISLRSAFHDLSGRSTFGAAAVAAFVLLGASNVNAQGLPALDKVLNPAETALILVDFQYPFTNPAGANYHNVQKELDEKHLLDRTVDLVKKARSLGITVVHITEGYTHDYRELDPTNPGGFHRGQILRQAWKVGTKETSYYEPLQPGEGDKDLFLPPRIQTTAFGGTGLDQMLRSKGIKNVAVAGFTTDVCVYATVTSAYDLGYHVYALRDAMAGYFPEQSEQMLKNTYPMWSKVIGNDDFLGMFGLERRTER
jgi:ureidoacrylate peracid hydrolase